ncbi:hypothetical protein ACOMHN_023792 [Nucella lapillus]
MLTEMALSSDRMRFKDKIIANIAKAIKGIQEAVFFKNRTTADDSPLVLCNNDRQCHKLCENLDHVFLHGLRQHSHGYWKVVTEYTHKNAVREIKNLRNVTTDLGRGRAWIFMALNDMLLESYIRCITQHTKMLKKHYAKDALLLDQQQMSVLLTLTSGLECAVFQLEYDLPYLDLTAYPPRTRTASEVEEEVDGPRGAVKGVAASLRPSTETAASTPESSKALTDSDTASLSSLDTPALRSARISSVSMDSGFPGDILTQQNSKQRSVTPIDTLSVSSHGSGGEPDRLTRLENIVNRTDTGMEEEDGGLEVIRMKSGKKLIPGAKKKKGTSAKKDARGSMSREQSVTSTDSVSASAPVGIGQTSSVTSLEGAGFGKGSPGRNSLYGKSPPNWHDRESPHCENGSSTNGSSMGEKENSTDIRNEGDSSGVKPTTGMKGEGDTGNAACRNSDVERMTAEMKDSFADGFAQLDTAVASIRATATTLHQHPEWAAVTSQSPSSSSSPPPFQNIHSGYEYSQQSSSSRDLENSCFNPSAIACDKDTATGERNAKVPGSVVNSQPSMSAQEKLESRCAQLCRPLSVEENVDGGHRDIADSALLEQRVQTLSNTQEEERSLNREAKRAGDSQVPARDWLEEKKEEEEVDFYLAPDKVGLVSADKTTHNYSRRQDYVDFISGHYGDDSSVMEERVGVDEEGNIVETESPTEGNRDYALRLDNNTKLQIMLDIFTHDDEEFLKMFVSREGHSEGEQKVAFVLVTSHALYLLRQRDADRKFETEIAIRLKDLSFISLSLNKQIVNIESTGPNRRKERVWLTPGDQLLAQQMLDCLEEAMKRLQQPSSVRSHFSVGSDEPLQIIALRKYIARDYNCQVIHHSRLQLSGNTSPATPNCQEMDVEIEDYSLVFWEDTQSNKSDVLKTSLKRP